MSPRLVRATVLVALTGGLTTVLAVVAMGPFEPDPDRAMTRYIIAIPADSGLSILALMGLASAFRAPPDLRRPAILMAAGITCYAIGNWIWFGFNLAGSDVPYPSIADIPYVAFPICSVIAGLILLRATRRRLQGVDITIGLVFPLTILLIFYAILIQPRFEGRTDLVRTTMDLAYPTLDALSVSIAGSVLLFSRPTPVQGALRRATLAMILFGVADTAYLLTIDHETYFSGSWTDLLYYASTFGYALAVIGFAKQAGTSDRPGTHRGPAASE